MLRSCSVLALMLLATAFGQNAPNRRLYIEERIKIISGASTHCDDYGNCYGHGTTRERNVSAELTREILTKCPDVITVTDNRDAADYVLRIAPGSSTVYNANGDAVYISPAKWKVKNLAKDVCQYVTAQK
jgi:hypothetical protein